MRADPAAAAARGEFTRSGWGYLAMVCVYLYGMVCPSNSSRVYSFGLHAKPQQIYCMSWQGTTWVCGFCTPVISFRLTD